MKNRILIVYYSLTGVSGKVAGVLKEKTGADIYEVKTERTYNMDMWKAWDEAQAETASGKLPELKGQPPDLNGYDVVLLGGPVWGWTISNPMLAYIRQTDFAGKVVSAYWTFYDHDEKYEKDVEKECVGAVVKKGLSLTNSDMAKEDVLTEKLAAWIDSLNIL